MDGTRNSNKGMILLSKFSSNFNITVDNVTMGQNRAEFFTSGQVLPLNRNKNQPPSNTLVSRELLVLSQNHLQLHLTPRIF